MGLFSGHNSSVTSSSLLLTAHNSLLIALLYTLNDDPQPQVLFTFGFSNLNPAPSSVST